MSTFVRMRYGDGQSIKWTALTPRVANIDKVFAALRI